MTASSASWPLSQRMHDHLRRGDVRGEYASDWGAVQALATAMVAAKWTPARIREALADPSNVGARHVQVDKKGRPRRRMKTVKLIETLVEKAHAYLDANSTYRDKNEFRAAVAEMKRAADATPFKGKGGATDRRVLDACYQLAIRAGKVELHLSVRDIARIVVCGVSTASRSLKRLEGRWLQRIGQANGNDAARYRLVTPRAQSEHTLFPGGIYECSDSAHSPAHAEVFSWSGLGPATGRTYDLLGLEPASVADLAAACDVTPGTARRHLRKLAEHGLAVDVMDGWVRGGRPLETVADNLGVVGLRDAVALRVQEERLEYRNHRSGFRHEVIPHERFRNQVVAVPAVPFFVDARRRRKRRETQRLLRQRPLVGEAYTWVKSETA